MCHNGLYSPVNTDVLCACPLNCAIQIWEKNTKRARTESSLLVLQQITSSSHPSAGRFTRRCERCLRPPSLRQTGGLHTTARLKRIAHQDQALVRTTPLSKTMTEYSLATSNLSYPPDDGNERQPLVSSRAYQIDGRGVRGHVQACE